ncbi:ABC transporter permease [Actinomadura rupiterrae]|uniref:ABC transporter permease n=1 Tax=Actinomadura rupiterrae TaxID=559627 RepID=UPI0020A40D7B|nr:ABC transporter permease [Actinomadura rupiterrae]MCP2343094.1 ABC-2 type transport system permease protein [Actinomadura rupiterrae]
MTTTTSNTPSGLGGGGDPGEERDGGPGRGRHDGPGGGRHDGSGGGRHGGPGRERHDGPGNERHYGSGGGRGGGSGEGGDGRSGDGGGLGGSGAAAVDGGFVEERGGVARTLRDTRLIFLRYVRQMLRNKVGVAFGLTQPLLYLVLFGPLLGKIGGVQGAGGGNTWRAFVPGILVQLALFGAGFVGFGLIADLRSGVVERLRVTPVSRLALLLGRVLRDTLLLVVQAVMLLATSVVLGLRAPLWGIAVGLVFVALLALSIASLSYVLAMATRVEDAFAPLLSTVTLPLMLLSGIILPMDMAPTWLDAVSRCTPFRYVVDAARAAFRGDFSSPSVLEGAAVTAVLVLVSVTLGTHRFRRENA